MDKGVTGVGEGATRKDWECGEGWRRGGNTGTKEYSSVLLKSAENWLNTSGAAGNPEVAGCYLHCAFFWPDYGDRDF